MDKVHHIVYFKDMAIRSKKAAIGFAEAAVKHMYKGGLSVNAEQNTKGGIMLHRSAYARPSLLRRRPAPACRGAAPRGSALARAGRLRMRPG